MALRFEPFNKLFHAAGDEKEFVLTNLIIQNLVTLMNLYAERREYFRAVDMRTEIINLMGNFKQIRFILGKRAWCFQEN